MRINIGVFLCTLLTAVAARADVKIIVTLVPENPGPYVGGESFPVHVYLANQDVVPRWLQTLHLDFRATPPGVTFGSTFSFDWPSPNYFTLPAMPDPWISFGGIYGPDDNMITFPAAGNGTWHAGSVMVTLPMAEGTYVIDPLNANTTSVNHSTGMTMYPDNYPDDDWLWWFANEGEVIGDMLTFEVCHQCQLYGDIEPPLCPSFVNGQPQPNCDTVKAGDCDADADDILLCLDDFSGLISPPQVCDIEPCGGGLGPDGENGDGDTDADDLIAVLDAFSGLPACADPCPP